MDNPSEFTMLPPQPEAVARAMQRIQQGLLARGFVYLAGDETAWPLGHVVMANEHRIVYLAVWAREEFMALRRRWERFLGEAREAELLLVGAESVDDAAVQAFIAGTRGTLVYLDALTLTFRQQVADWVTAPSLTLRAELFTHLFDSAQDDALAAFDARATLRAHLAAGPRVADARPAQPPWPVLTYGLIAACLLVFLATLFTAGPGGLGGMPTQVLLPWGALYKPLIAQGEWWRLITSGFLHGSLIHFGMNMLALYIFAIPLESWLGRWRLGVIFLCSVVTGNLLSLQLLPDAVSVGASGGLFGFLGAMAALLARYHRAFPAAQRRQLFSWLKTVLLYNVFISFIPGINFAAHFGGLVGGFLLGLLLARSPARG